MEAPVKFKSREEVINMTPQQAREVVLEAAKMLHKHLTPCHYPEYPDHPQEPHGFHSDDGMDDLGAATDHWVNLHEIDLEHGWLPVKLAESVAHYLLTAPEGACDGELRMDLFTSDLFDETMLKLAEAS